MQNLWCVTVFFNPARFKSLLQNYYIFSAELKRQGVNLLTVELAFNDDEFQIPDGPNVRRLRSSSVMWQKERLINYGISQTPDDCDAVAWLDCDVLFTRDDWATLALAKLEKADIIQLFKKVSFLPAGVTDCFGVKAPAQQGVIWQHNIHKNWLERRKNKELHFSAPGFAWAARKETFADIGIYDKNIVGSGDTFLVDCYLNSWEIHGYAAKFNDRMKADMAVWKQGLDAKKVNVDYLPVDIFHLWHGTTKNRQYMQRHDIITMNDYDPQKDIKLVNNVYEWASEKPAMHEAINKYFYDRKEDEVE